MDENYNNCHHQKTTHTFIYTKSKKICYTLLYKKSQTLFKKLDAWQRARQFAIRFYIQKSGTFALRDFSLNFRHLRRGGGHLFIEKTMHFAWHFYIEKTMHFAFVAIYKESDTMCYILISKKQNTILYVYMHIIYDVVLILNYKRTYDQSEQIEK